MDFKQKILIINQDSFGCGDLVTAFSVSYMVLEAQSGEEALGVLSKEYVDLILLDVSGSNEDSLRFLRFIKHNTEYKRIPLLIIGDDLKRWESSYGNAFKVDEYLLKPITTTTLLQKVSLVLDKERSSRRQLVEYYKLVKEARHDDLTGLYKRRTGCQLIEEELKQGGQNALLYIDIDDFKTVNDRFGHDMGDKVLLALTCELRQFFRNSDIIVRLGGDEFCVFVADITPNRNWLEKKCADLLRKVACISVGGICITCSIGAAQAPEDGVTFEELYRKDEGAMYNIKGENKQGFRIFNGETAFLTKAEASRAKLELLNSSILTILGFLEEPEMPLYVISRAFPHLLGYPTRSAFLQSQGPKLRTNCLAEEADKAYEDMVKQLDEKNEFEILLRLRKVKGGFIWLLLKGFRRNKSQNRKEILAIGLDVTSLKEKVL